MKSSFFIPNKKVPDVKRLIRELPSLRFECNPMMVGDSTHFCLTGDVEEFNKLHLMIDKLMEPEKIPEPTGVFSKLKKSLWTIFLSLTNPL